MTVYRSATVQTTEDETMSAELEESNQAAAAALSRCWMCGNKAAMLACSECKEARYCSEACQKNDWIDGCHKTLCQGPPSAMKINMMVRELIAAEYEWLTTVLVDGDEDQLFWEDSCDKPTNHLILGGQVALVLARVNASAFLCNSNIHTWHFGTKFYNQVLCCWYERHQEFLNSQGFFVEMISHHVHLTDCHCPCEKNGGPCGNLSSLGEGVPLVKDLNNSKKTLDLINKVFTKPRSPKLEDWPQGEVVQMSDMMECISFRTTKVPAEGTGMSVQYLFLHTGQALGCEDLCCSPCLKMRFNIDPKDAIALGLHFRKARQAMAAIGFAIVMDMLEQEAWLGQTWFAAAGSINTFAQWLKNDTLPFSVRVDEDRYIDIVRNVFQRSLPGE